MELTQENTRQLRPSAFENFVEKFDGLFIDFRQLETAVRDNSFYKVHRISDRSGHRYGDGGETEEKTVLTRLGKPVLISRQFQSYMTYSDDSEDYPSEKINDTYLIEEDSLAREVVQKFKG